MTNKIITKKVGAVGHIVFNNPEKLNAISLEMWEGLGRAVDMFDADREVRVIVLSGAGCNSFVSGADASNYEAERIAECAYEHYARTGERALSMLHDSIKVTVAAIDGWCIGAGVSVAVCCDLRYCSAKSKFGQPAIRYGVGYGYNSLRRLVDVVGVTAAKDLLLGGLQLNAQEAYIKGFVGRVLPDKEFKVFIDQTVASIAAGAPLTARQIKFTLNDLVKEPADRDIDKCEELFRRCTASQDFKEGIRAFVEKRKPEFIGS
jgi:enoyl-CoA hydratase/carnithine racemase